MNRAAAILMFIACASAIASPPTFHAGQIDASGNVSAPSFSLGGNGSAGEANWAAVSTAPTGSCVNGSMRSVISNVSPAFYICADGSWLAVAGGTITGDGTAGTVPVYKGAETIGNSDLTDDTTAHIVTESGGGIAVNTNGDSELWSTFYPAGMAGLNIWIGGGGQLAVAGSNAQFSSYNTSLGHSAMKQATVANYNVAVGEQAAENCTSCEDNVIVGQHAARNITTGTENTAVGVQALQAVGSGGGNTAVGISTLQSSTASNNTAIGANAEIGDVTGANNVCVGELACSTNNGGSDNTVVGTISLRNSTTGDHNTVIGYSTGNDLTTGRANTIIGANISGLSSSLSNNIVISDGDGHQRINVDSNGNSTLAGSVKINETGPTITSGAGAPVINCAVGDQYNRTNGAVGSVIYYCDSTNHWTAIASGGITNTASVNIVPVTSDSSGDMVGSPITVNGSGIIVGSGSGGTLVDIGPAGGNQLGIEAQTGSAALQWLFSCTSTICDINTAGGSAAPTTGTQIVRIGRHITLNGGAALQGSDGRDFQLEGTIGNSGTAAWIFSARNYLQANRGFGVAGGEEHLTGTVFASNGTIVTNRSTPTSGNVKSLTASSTSLTFTFNGIDTLVSGYTYPVFGKCTASAVSLTTPFIVQPNEPTVGGGSATVTFACFTPSTGALVTCPEFNYDCVYGN